VLGHARYVPRSAHRAASCLARLWLHCSLKSGMPAVLAAMAPTSSSPVSEHLDGHGRVVPGPPGLNA
jgi:hypothetical protein